MYIVELKKKVLVYLKQNISVYYIKHKTIINQLIVLLFNNFFLNKTYIDKNILDDDLKFIKVNINEFYALTCIIKDIINNNQDQDIQLSCISLEIDLLYINLINV